MLPLLAALPAIFSAVTKFSDLFNSGKKAVEKVKGSASIASSPAELQTEVQSLTPEQQAQWAKTMQQQVDLYAAQTQRLVADIGLVDSNITSKVSPEAASKIAVLRQTTRPWAVRMMVHYIFFPFYLIIIDLVQELINVWVLKGVFRGPGINPVKTFDYVFGPLNPVNLANINAGVLDQILNVFKQNGTVTLIGKMYMDAVPWVTGIIVSYMGLREWGKIKGKSGDGEMPPDTPTGNGGGAAQIIAKAAGAGGDLIGKVKAIFGR
jgi:hypothetical protein